MTPEDLTSLANTAARLQAVRQTLVGFDASTPRRNYAIRCAPISGADYRFKMPFTDFKMTCTDIRDALVREEAQLVARLAEFGVKA